MTAPGGGAALAALRRVRVGSENPPKIAGVRAAVAAFAPEVSVEGVAVASGVAEQPVGFEEILAGARRRAEGARESGPCDLAVGYEDGLVRVDGPDGRWFNVGCAAVSDGAREGLGLSAGFRYPPGCAERAATGREPIGELFDRLWRARGGVSMRRAEPGEPSALSVGNVGKLTGGALTRADYTRQAVLCALARFLQPELFEGIEGVVDGEGAP